MLGLPTSLASTSRSRSTSSNYPLKDASIRLLRCSGPDCSSSGYGSGHSVGSPKVPQIHSILETLDKLLQVRSQRPSVGDSGPSGPSGPTGLPGPPGDSGLQDNPDLARRLYEVKHCLYQVCRYLDISASGVPIDATCSLDELFHLVAAFEADSLQDAAKIDSLRAKTNQQAAAISALQTKVEQLELASLNQSSVALAAFQDAINAIRRDLNCPCSEPPRRRTSTPQPSEEEDSHIHRWNCKRL